MFLKICFVFFVCGISNSFQSVLRVVDPECRSTVGDTTFHNRPVGCSFQSIHERTKERSSTSLLLRKKKDVNNKQPKYLQKCLEYENLYKEFKSKSVSSPVETTTISKTGHVSQKNYLPHMVFIGFGDPNEKNYYCAGTLISENFVLSSANCLFNRERNDEEIYVMLPNPNPTAKSNEETRRIFKIAEKIKHPKFQPPLIYNDIGLLKLDRKVQFSKYILPACLHDKNDVPELDLTTIDVDKNKGYIANLLDDFVQADIQLYEHSLCNETYSKKGSQRRQKYGIIDDTQFCAVGKGENKSTCKGLGGSAVQFRKPSGIYEVVGITTYGFPCGSDVDAGVYTRVSAFVSWIDSIVWP